MTQDDLDHLRDLGVATVYEAGGRVGLIDIPLIQIIPGSRAAGPARTVLCGQDDNLMVHAMVEHIQPGDVVVITMPMPKPIALVGELLATQIKVRGASAILIDASVRDVEELVKLGLPIWTRYVRVRGATKIRVGQINVPVTIGGTMIQPNDIVVLDADGAVSIPQDQTERVLAASQERFEREARLREKLVAGERSFDLHGLRKYMEQNRQE